MSSLRQDSSLNRKWPLFINQFSMFHLELIRAVQVTISRGKESGNCETYSNLICQEASSDQENVWITIQELVWKPSNGTKTYMYLNIVKQTVFLKKLGGPQRFCWVHEHVKKHTRGGVRWEVGSGERWGQVSTFSVSDMWWMKIIQIQQTDNRYSILNHVHSRV